MKKIFKTAGILLVQFCAIGSLGFAVWQTLLSCGVSERLLDWLLLALVVTMIMLIIGLWIIIRITLREPVLKIREK